MKKIKIQKSFQIPGTDVILEKGDVITLKEAPLMDLTQAMYAAISKSPDNSRSAGFMFAVVLERLLSSAFPGEADDFFAGMEDLNQRGF